MLAASKARFRGGVLDHPKTDIGKPQWFLVNSERKRAQVLPAGHYVVVKRFTAKEEHRRVVAYPLDIAEPIALENRLNFIHAGTPRRIVPLASSLVSKGLAAWLNTSFVDEWFRGTSGSTQVNASDLRATPCPDLQTLTVICSTWEPCGPQELTDTICSEALPAKFKDTVLAEAVAL